MAVPISKRIYICVWEVAVLARPTCTRGRLDVLVVHLELLDLAGFQDLFRFGEVFVRINHPLV